MTGDPYRTNLEITRDNHYYYRDTGQFIRDWFKMDSQETFEAFLNTNELPILTKLIDILIILYQLLRLASINVLHLNVLQEKSAS